MFDEIKITTPFGDVSLPKISLPPLKPPKIDDRRRKAFDHAVAIDLASIFGWIPIIGDIIADVVEDVHGAELEKILTPDEYKKFLKHDKVAPTTVAVIRTFMESD